MRDSIYSSLEQRLQQLQRRGLMVEDSAQALEQISHIGYYRISQMVQLIERQEPNRVLTFGELAHIFDAEQQLRSQLMALISLLEINFRSVVSEYYGMWYGAHGYKKESHFSDEALHHALLRKVGKQLHNKAMYEVINETKHVELETLPVWVAAELSTFHMLTLFLRLLPYARQTEIAREFGVSAEHLTEWLDFLLVVRNAGAHQGLLFGRTFDRIVTGRDSTVGTALILLEQLLAPWASDEIARLIQASKASDGLAGYRAYYGLTE